MLIKLRIWSSEEIIDTKPRPTVNKISNINNNKNNLNIKVLNISNKINDSNIDGKSIK